MSSVDLDALLARLRQLSLVRVEAVLDGVTGDDRAALVEALADDLEDALGRAHQQAVELLAQLGRGPGPLAAALARASSRRSADPETRQRWRDQLRQRAERARDLHRLWAAATAVLPVLEDADRNHAD